MNDKMNDFTASLEETALPQWLARRDDRSGRRGHNLVVRENFRWLSALWCGDRGEKERGVGGVLQTGFPWRKSVRLSF